MSNPEPEPGDIPLLGIGELAELAGKRPSSIRYYEQIGLLPQPVRVNGRRRYDPGTVRTLAVIETGQRAGLTLDEIKALLSASPDDSAAIDRLREVADRKLPEIMALIERSELVRGWLECAARCECPNLDQCPLFDDPPLLPGHDSDRIRPPRSGSRRASVATIHLATARLLAQELDAQAVVTYDDRLAKAANDASLVTLAPED